MRKILPLVMVLGLVVVATTVGICSAQEDVQGNAAEEGIKERVSVEGTIFYSDYYSMEGTKCAAFLEAEDGSIFCVLDTMLANNLRSEMDNTKGKVKVKGGLLSSHGGEFLDIKDYTVEEVPAQEKK